MRRMHYPVFLPFFLSLLLLTLWLCAASAEEAPRVHAITDARIVLEPGREIERGTVVIRDGLIESVGDEVAIPADARIWDGEGLTVYPGLIEPYLRLSRVLDSKPVSGDWKGPPLEPRLPGTADGHPRVRPERGVAEELDLSGDWWGKLHSLGFTSAYVLPDSGIFRGRGALLGLRAGRVSALRLPAAELQCLAYDEGLGPMGYPRSLMGVVALMRQTLHDARWYAEATRIYGEHPVGLERPELNRSLAVLGAHLAEGGGFLIEARDVLAVLRAGAFVREFELNGLLRGSGEEYKRVDDVAALGLPLVLPLAFPERPELESEEDEWDLDLARLRAWDRAPSNPALLRKAGVRFAFTSDGLEKPEKLWNRIRAAIARGLPEEVALAALTVEPARMLGMGDRLGSIGEGRIANLTVTDGEIFAHGTRVRQVWVDGLPQGIAESAKEAADPRGLWRITADREAIANGARVLPGWLSVRGNEKTPTALWIDPSGEELLAPGVKSSGDSLVVSWNSPRAPARLLLRRGFAGAKQGEIVLNKSEDAILRVRAERRSGPPVKEEALPETATPISVVPGPIPGPDELLVTGATIWTCGPDGIIENGDLRVSKGKILEVGRGLRAGKRTMVIDAKGMHLTPGMMDCHSHAMIVGGVNEWTVASSAMVTIEDVVNSETPNIYRHLAGGTTLANLFHGSANPIGGKSAVIKLRWGQPPAGLLLAGAPPGIKFALGENVTQKSWGGPEYKRFPKTRMGVEQFFRDRFSAARDYAAEREAYGKLSRKEKQRSYPPRRDLELDTLVEILRSERYVHSHAYRADEVLMLMRVAEEFGWRVRTFQHILEGYKVANEMAAHGAGGSSFSDWWAYKPEVYDAIPYNGALMHERGVSVTFNSDSGELARRLNLEGAKAVRYGGVDPEDALKFLTLNVAEQLGFADRLGSLEPGKDADFVLWSGDPLSTSTICMQTWIEGEKYFDRQNDLLLRTLLAEERETLLAKVRRAKPAREEGERPEDGDLENRLRSGIPDYLVDEQLEMHCDGDEYHEGGVR